MPEVISEMGAIELPYDVPNPERLKAAVEMLMEELPDEMKGDFVAFWQQSQAPAPEPALMEETIVDEGPLAEEVMRAEVPA